MASPFGHHHHRRDDDDENHGYGRPPPPGPPSNYPPPPPGLHQTAYGTPHPQPYPPVEPHFAPPPPSIGGGGYRHSAPPPPSYPQPPPPQAAAGVYHSSHSGPFDSLDYPPPPPPSQPTITIAEHHEEHHFRPHIHFPGHGHYSGAASELDELSSKPTFRIFCKAGGDRFAVAVRDGKVILTYADLNDPTQHWIKDEKYSTKVKDKDGYPSFALVNKATKHALKHSISAHPVQLIRYEPDVFDGSILWTESKDLGHGYRTIRMVNNIKLVLDAFHGDKDHGGVHDGTVVALYESWKGDNQNQQWKLVPYCKISATLATSYQIVG